MNRIILGKHLSEDDEADYRQQNAEEAERSRLERIALLRGPDAAEPCEACEGSGGSDHETANGEAYWIECGRCLGTGVQP